MPPIRHRRPGPVYAAAAAVAAGLATALLLAAAGRAPARSAPRVPSAAARPTAVANPTATQARPGATESPTTATPTTRSVVDPPSPDAERVAAAFTAAYLTFHWRDSAGALRQRCRPWDTDEVDAALTEPGEPPDRARRAADREDDGVEIRAVNPQDRAGDHLDASVVAAVTIALGGQAGQAITEVLDLRVVATPDGWLVAQVSQ